MLKGSSERESREDAEGDIEFFVAVCVCVCGCVHVFLYGARYDELGCSSHS